MDASHPMIPQPRKVKRVIRETHDTFTLCVEQGAGGPEKSFSPGQFNMLYAFGVGEVPISISGDPAEPDLCHHTIRNVGTVTRALANLKAGDTVGVRGPFGSAWPVKESRGNDIVIIAGGIGLAPLRPAIYSLLEERERFGEIVLLYGARTQEDLLFTEEFEKWRGKYGVQVRVTIDSAGPNWKGNVGVVTTLFPGVRFDPANTVAMICGPEVMMRFAVIELKNCGIEDKNIYVTMERNMKCAIGFCGHCQFGPAFICKDGPVFQFAEISPFFGIREI
jgi:NAD(P)H-flavin reductase